MEQKSSLRMVGIFPAARPECNDERTAEPSVRQQHDCGMPTAKRKVSITLDEDLVAEIEAEGDGLSNRVNEALRVDLTKRRRQRALGKLLDRLEAERGPLNTPEDEAEIQRFMELLGGPAGPAAESPARRPSGSKPRKATG